MNKGHFTIIPNDVIRSKKLDVYDFRVLACIASCCGNDQAGFPSYEKLAEWTGLSRDRVWKSLRKLDRFNLIRRYKKEGDQKVFYKMYWMEDPNQLNGAKRINYVDNSENSVDKPVRHTDYLVRNTDYPSTPHGLEPVRRADPIKTHYKYPFIKETDFEKKEIGNGKQNVDNLDGGKNVFLRILQGLKEMEKDRQKGASECLTPVVVVPQRIALSDCSDPVESDPGQSAQYQALESELPF